MKTPQQWQATPLSKLELTTRSRGGCAKHRIKTVWQLTQWSKRGLMATGDFGRRGVKELEEVLGTMGLVLAAALPPEPKKKVGKREPPARVSKARDMNHDLERRVLARHALQGILANAEENPMRGEGSEIHLAVAEEAVRYADATLAVLDDPDFGKDEG